MSKCKLHFPVPAELNPTEILNATALCWLSAGVEVAFIPTRLCMSLDGGYSRVALNQGISQALFVGSPYPLLMLQ